MVIILLTVYGALLGIQEGRNVQICNSFELLVKSVEGGGTIHDMEFFSSKEKQGETHTHFVDDVCICVCMCLLTQ